MKPMEESKFLHLEAEYSGEYDVVLTQLMKAKNQMGSAVKKDSTNPFHKSKYASLGAHLELCEPVLFENGLLLMHTTNFISNSPILISTLYHPESKQWVKSYLPLPNSKNDSQGLGSSITYMRRYSINCMLGLTAEDDDGETSSGRGKYDKKDKNQSLTTLNDHNKQSTVEKHADNRITHEQCMEIIDGMAKVDDTFKTNYTSYMQSTWGTNKYEDLPPQAYVPTMNGIKRNIEMNKQKQVQDAVN